MDKREDELIEAFNTIESILEIKLLGLKNMLANMYRASPVNMEEIIQEIEQIASSIER